MIKKTSRLALMIASAALLAACASGSKSEDGLKWPRPYSVTFNKNRGTFPDLGSLKQIRQGATKDQLYYLIGRPHYDEGFRVSEWNYLFHFNTPGQGTDNITTCQYKVKFDKHRRAQSFHWRAVDPENAVCPPAQEQPAPAMMAQPQMQMQRIVLSADALFAFDKGDLAHMNAQGKAKLDDVAAKLGRLERLDQVRIIGHTDYLGSDSYNMRLSQQRAETVRNYLISRGVPANVLYAYGAGKTQPVKQCDNRGNRAELIACLQPNRRVELEVNGMSISNTR